MTDRFYPARPAPIRWLSQTLAWLSRRFFSRLSAEEWTEVQAIQGGSGLPPAGGETTVLVPLGSVPLSALYTARNILFDTFVHDVLVVEPVSVPAGAYNDRRRQYRAYHLIKALEEKIQPDTFRVIGLIDADIYIPGTHFIFGTGMQGSRAIVISLPRLAPPAGASLAGRNSRFAGRLSALVISQVSAGLGLGPCATATCARAFTNSLADLDGKTAHLCPACAARIAPWLKPAAL